MEFIIAHLYFADCDFLYQLLNGCIDNSMDIPSNSDLDKVKKILQGRLNNKMFRDTTEEIKMITLINKLENYK